MKKSSTANSIVYILVGLILVGFIGYLLDRHSQDARVDAQSEMAQKVLASGVIPNMEADSDYTEGMKQLDAGSYQNALMALNSAIASNPKDPRYFSARAKAKEHLGDLDGAAADKKAADALSSNASPPPGQ
jgi:Flp pilus assembly protein TadD